MIKVKPLTVNKKTVNNHYLIDCKNYTVFQSYETPIAIVDNSNGTIRVTDKKYSRTTSKYTNLFLSQYKNYNVFYVTEEELEDIIRLCI